MFKKLLAKFINFIESRQAKKNTDPAPVTDVTEFTEVADGEPAGTTQKPRMPYFVRRGLWAVCLTCILTGVFTMSVFIWYAFVYVEGEFDLSYLDNTLNYTTVIYGTDDGETVEVERLHGTENREWANIDEISPYLQDAVVAIEDERFYKHSGVDIKRTLGAVLDFVTGDGSYGGSTITQQLIKNLTDDDDHTITRKIQEMRRAWYLESQYNKPQILEVYLNTIYLSQGCYGVQTASEKYFGKTAAELSIAEAACLASITNLPGYYDPLTNLENNQKRAHLVINKMVELKMITAEEGEAAKAQTLVFSDGTGSSQSSGVKSYFVDAVTEAVINDLVEKKGYSEVYAETLIYSGGLQIYTTMDVDVQNAVDSVYKDPANFPSIYSTDKDGNRITPESAIAVIENSTGACVALYGGIGEKTTARGTNRATMAFRQPGSSIKPLSTYAPAIEYGVCLDGNNALSPSSMILDWYIDEEKQYPHNQSRYESNKKVTLTAGVAQSLNTVAARVNMALGFTRSFNFLEDNLGFTSLVSPEENSGTNDMNVASLALGALSKGVNVLEMSAAYASFPNDGVYTKPYLYTKVVDQNGRVILENNVESRTAMSTETARVINQLLSYAASAGTGTPANFGTTEIAGKTGTTSEDYDRWFAGYTSYYSATVWYGYDYNKTVYYGGQNPAATTWKKVMSKVHSGLAYKALTKPTTLVTSGYCFESGMLLSENCTMKASGSFLPDGVPTKVCDIHVVEEPVTETPQTTTPSTTTPSTTTPSTTTPSTTTPSTTTPPTTTKPSTTEPEKTTE